MSAPLELWQGEWGDAYHDRNRFTPEQVQPVFDRILGGITFQSVLEVGSGLGHNLAAIHAKVRTGVEPNQQALAEARNSYPDISFLNGDVLDLPFFDDSFDVVLTCGLLIHIHPDSIERAVAELARVSNRYVALVEYGFPVEEEREYRGHRDVLWVRPYGKLFQAWEGFTLVAHDPNPSDMYPGAEWWLMAKPSL